MLLSLGLGHQVSVRHKGQMSSGIHILKASELEKLQYQLSDASQGLQEE